MASDPVSAGLGAVSLITGIGANNSAQNSANSANRNAKKLSDRQLQISQMLQNIVQGADKAGQFDPQRQLDQLSADTNYYSNLDQQNAAGVARTLGYRPGDTAPLTQGRGISDQYRLNYGKMANQIRTDAFNNKLAAYGAIGNSAAQVAQTGMPYYQNQQQLALGQMQSPSGFLSSIMPFLNQQRQQQQKPIAFGMPVSGSSR